MLNIKSKKSSIYVGGMHKFAFIFIIFLLYFVIEETPITAILTSVFTTDSLIECIFNSLENVSQLISVQSTNKYFVMTIRNFVCAFAMLTQILIVLCKDKNRENTEQYIFWFISSILFLTCTIINICIPTIYAIVIFIKTIFDFLSNFYNKDWYQEIIKKFKGTKNKKYKAKKLCWGKLHQNIKVV